MMTLKILKGILLIFVILNCNYSDTKIKSYDRSYTCIEGKTYYRLEGVQGFFLALDQTKKTIPCKKIPRRKMTH